MDQGFSGMESELRVRRLTGHLSTCKVEPHIGGVESTVSHGTRDGPGGGRSAGLYGIGAYDIINERVRILPPPDVPEHWCQAPEGGRRVYLGEKGKMCFSVELA